MNERIFVIVGRFGSPLHMKIPILSAATILLLSYALTGCAVFDEKNPSFADHTGKDIYAMIPVSGILKRASELNPGSRVDIHLVDKSVVITEFDSVDKAGINGKVVESNKLESVYYYETNPTEITGISYSKILHIKAYSIPPRAMPSKLQAEAFRNKFRKKLSVLGPGGAVIVLFFLGAVASL